MSTLNRLQGLVSWKLHGSRRSTCFSAWTHTAGQRPYRSARVLVRRRRDESIEHMVTRGLDELLRRLADGMPPPNPEVVARRKLRNATPASRFAN